MATTRRSALPPRPAAGLRASAPGPCAPPPAQARSFPAWWPRHEFHWRWSILFVSFALLVADFVYFDALRNPDALVSLVSSLRRGSVLVAFAGGLFLYKEKHGLAKLPAVLGVVIGIVLTILD